MNGTVLVGRPWVQRRACCRRTITGAAALTEGHAAPTSAASASCPGKQGASLPLRISALSFLHAHGWECPARFYNRTCCAGLLLHHLRSTFDALGYRPACRGTSSGMHRPARQTGRLLGGDATCWCVVAFTIPSPAPELAQPRQHGSIANGGPQWARSCTV